MGLEGSPERGDLIDNGNGGRADDRANDEPAGFEPAETLRQGLLRDACIRPPQGIEPHRPTAKTSKNEKGPLGGDLLEHRPIQFQGFRRRRRHGPGYSGQPGSIQVPNCMHV